MPDEYISRRDARIAILEKQAGGGVDQKITVGTAEAVINAVPAADVRRWCGAGTAPPGKETLALPTARTDTVSSTILIQTGRISAATENGGKNEHYTFEISHR